ncbi:hypothetical protein AAFF_G00093430 [Aldrovandia affinis]|uniref:Uncharacterized protein n=1 Tax=Aldrovandia affinis TaxID=143900 RepID=A0AAD7T3Y4_9TELE|nr:hypothetical protein AAFF_G00093430 [Aldrovandia affinis]
MMACERIRYLKMCGQEDDQQSQHQSSEDRERLRDHAPKSVLYHIHTLAVFGATRRACSTEDQTARFQNGPKHMHSPEQRKIMRFDSMC